MLTTLAKLPLSSRRSEHERVQPNKMNIEIRSYSRSNSYLNSALIRQLHLVMNSLFAVEHMAWHLFMAPLSSYTMFIMDYTFKSAELCPPLYFAEKVDLAHSAIEGE